MNTLKDYRKLYGLFHTANLLKANSILDFGGSLARSTIFSRRYWTSWLEHMDIPPETRLDSFDLFGACQFPVYGQVYDNIYQELDNVLANYYGIAALIDVIPYIEADVLLELLSLLREHCSCLLLQFSGEPDFPLERLHNLGHCMQATFAAYDYIVIQTSGL